MKSCKPSGDASKLNASNGKSLSRTILSWHSAEIEYIRYATRGICSAAESENKNPVARAIAFHNRFVAIDNILGDSGTKCCCDDITKRKEPDFRAHVYL